MAQISPYTTDTATTFQLTSMNGAGTPITQSIRAFPITGANSGNTNWGTAGINGLFGNPTFTNNFATGTFNCWATPTSTGAPTVSVTWRLNTFSNTLTFEPTTAANTFWLAFVFDDASTAYTFDDSNWSVSLLGSTQNAATGLGFFWGRNVTHNAGSLIGNSGGVVTSNGFVYNITPNLQANNAINWIVTGAGNPNVAITTYNSTLNWNGCTIRTGTATARTDLHLVFPFTANIRNLTIFNQGNIAVPNASVAAQAGVLDGISLLRCTLCPGNPLTAGSVIPTRFITGSTSGFGDRQQSLGAATNTDFTALASGGGLTNPAWISHRLNLRTGGGARSLVPRIDNGWRFLDTNGVAITTAYTNFYSTTSATPRNSGGTTASPFHQFEINYTSASATHVYEKVFQCRYLVSPANPDGSLKPNTLISFTNGDLTNGTRTRYIPRYVIASNLMTRPFPVNSTDTIPQSYLVTVLGQEVLASALYLYGKVDTTATSGFFGNFTPAYTDTNTLSPATGGNVTYDPTPVQVVWFDKWGSRLASRSQTALNSQLTTTFQVVLPEDAYIKLADDTSGSNVNRLAAQGLNLTITQTGGVNTSISAIAINAAMDGNDFYAGLEAWCRNITSNGLLRPVSEWSDPNTVAGILAFVTNVAALTIGAAVSRWTPTTGKAAISRIQLISPAGVVTFNASTLAATTMRFDANTINVNSQVINSDLFATTAITNLVTTGTVITGGNIGFGTGSALTLTGNIFITVGSLTGTLTLNPAGNATRVVSFTGATAGNLTGFNLVNATPATVISLLGWVGAIPNGFQVLTNYSVLLPNTVGTPLVNVRVNKLFRNNLAANVTNPTLTVTSNGLMLTWSGNAADRFSYCGFIDGLAPIFFDKPVNSPDSPAPQGGAIIDPDNLDFTQRANFVAADTTFINATTWTIGLNNITISAPTAIYDRSNSRPVSKMVLRAIMENANATPFHFGIATNAISNTIPLVNAIVFNSLGTMSQTGWALLWSKVSSSNNAILINLWNVDQTGTKRTISSLDVTTQIQFEGFSPGAVAELTGADLALIGIVAGEGNLGSFNTISNRVNQASLLVPSDTTPIT